MIEILILCAIVVTVCIVAITYNEYCGASILHIDVGPKKNPEPKIDSAVSIGGCPIPNPPMRQTVNPQKFSFDLKVNDLRHELREIVDKDVAFRFDQIHKQIDEHFNDSHKRCMKAARDASRRPRKRKK